MDLVPNGPVQAERNGFPVRSARERLFGTSERPRGSRSCLSGSRRTCAPRSYAASPGRRTPNRRVSERRRLRRVRHRGDLHRGRPPRRRPRNAGPYVPRCNERDGTTSPADLVSDPVVGLRGAISSYRRLEPEGRVTGTFSGRQRDFSHAVTSLQWRQKSTATAESVRLIDLNPSLKAAGIARSGTRRQLDVRASASRTNSAPNCLAQMPSPSATIGFLHLG